MKVLGPLKMKVLGIGDLNRWNGGLQTHVGQSYPPKKRTPQDIWILVLGLINRKPMVNKPLRRHYFWSGVRWGGVGCNSHYPNIRDQIDFTTYKNHDRRRCGVRTYFSIAGGV